jgi:hypothetical protein
MVGAIVRSAYDVVGLSEGEDAVLLLNRTFCANLDFAGMRTCRVAVGRAEVKHWWHTKKSRVRRGAALRNPGSIEAIIEDQRLEVEVRVSSKDEVQVQVQFQAQAQAPRRIKCRNGRCFIMSAARDSTFISRAVDRPSQTAVPGVQCRSDFEMRVQHHNILIYIQATLPILTVYLHQMIFCRD